MNEKLYYVYKIANATRILYTGVGNNLKSTGLGA